MELKIRLINVHIISPITFMARASRIHFPTRLKYIIYN